MFPGEEKGFHWRRSFFNALNYAPGLIILIFSMLALHSSLRLMNEHEDLQKFYNSESQRLFLLEEGFNDFERAFFRNAMTSGSSDEVNRKLRRFLNLHSEGIEALEKSRDSEISEDYRRNFYAIKSSLAFLSDFHGQPIPEEKMERIHAQLRDLRASLYGDEQAQVVSDTMRMRKNWLYWSVIAVGLSGFVLIILNADKLRQLQALNQEREDALELLEKRLAAMEATFDGIGIVDKNENLNYMNQALMDLHGIDRERAKEFLGHSWRNLYNEKGRENLEKYVMPELRRHGYWIGEAPIVRMNGDIVHAELSLTQLPDGGIIGTARDITERRRARQEKEDLQDQFFQAQKMEAIGRLAGGIAHDFNNILAAMNGYAEFLAEDLDKDSQQYAFARNILQAGRQARALVDQMLAFSRRNEGEIENVDLVVPLQEAVSMLKASLPKIIEMRTKIDVETAPIHGNATQITQLIMNLCVNARDAMEDKKGTLTLSLSGVDLKKYASYGMRTLNSRDAQKDMALMSIDDVAPGRTRLMLNSMLAGKDYICLTVQDNGCGMSRSVMEHIFEPFFTTKPVDKGTGLGLSTVHGVLIAHHGAMVVDSTLGEGTSFELLFPVSTEAVAAQEEEKETDDRFIVQGTKVLVVEDQDSVRNMMLTMLLRMGCEPMAAVNGLEALDILRERPDYFGLVITDHNMPKMTGLELVHQVHLDFPDIPFILLSGYGQKEMQEIMQEHPAVKAILRKPVAKAALAEKIYGVLRAETQARSAA